MIPMKPSNAEWLGDIPEEWDIARIGDFYKPRNEKVSDEYYAPLSVTMKGIVPQLAFAAKSDDHNNRKLVKKGDFVINSRSDRRGSCGISSYDGSVSLINTILTPRGEMNPDYYNWLFHTEQFADEFYKWGHGIVDDLWTTRWQEMKSIMIVSSPVDQQKAIADYLDDRCAKIDTIIAEAKTSIEEYKELKQAVIYDAVTKGLDKNADMKDSGIPAIGKVNEKFKIAKIGELQEGLTDGTHGTYQRLDSGELLLSSKNVQNEGLVVGNNESFISTEDYKAIVANGFPQKNDILLCCIGASIGRCILYPYNYPIAFQRSVIFIRTNHWMLPKFMLYSLQSPSSIMQENVIVNQSAQAGFYQGLVKQLYVTVPSINEQNKIVSYLDKKIKNIDDVISTKESLIEDLEYYRKSLIYEVVTGKRKVVD